MTLLAIEQAVAPLCSGWSGSYARALSAVLSRTVLLARLVYVAYWGM